VSGAKAAIGLLTRVPVGRVHAADLTRSIPWIPVVGAVIGLMVALAFAIALEVMPSLPSAAIGITTGIVLTGAFHEDGLADFADGLGGSDRDDVLRIMRDPVHGTYGALSLIAGFALRVTALAVFGGASALVILPAAHALARGAGIGLLAYLPPAAPDGVGAGYAEVGKGRVWAGILGALGIALLSVGWWAVPFAGLAAASALIIGNIARKRIHGYTGDVLGAVEQVAEISVLLAGAALVAGQLLSGAWWA
jgi:adenosylcobinamide-GDP ribazoletransferase